jgi:uncharacterized protein YhhL (DUF1145 family)
MALILACQNLTWPSHSKFDFKPDSPRMVYQSGKLSIFSDICSWCIQTPSLSKWHILNSALQVYILDHCSTVVTVVQNPYGIHWRVTILPINHPISVTIAVRLIVLVLLLSHLILHIFLHKSGVALANVNDYHVKIRTFLCWCFKLLGLHMLSKTLLGPWSPVLQYHPSANALHWKSMEHLTQLRTQLETDIIQ